ncbi:hypothetical protein C2G38_2144207 [Gigaspora rosea]|uniref:SWIM-type domain-containing protein n=1 Tax=Gigaspora rosea TaxID=44941 RepID=A0A397V4A5_9GLOM|nr:hypothetical protein C2G38_2144207 [Gigaspora rosea]
MAHSQCCKNEINKQLGHDGENKTILLRQTLKAFLKSVLNEARLIDGSEEIVRNYITKKKRLLECIYKAESLLENKKVLEGGLNFLSYLKKQWAGDLLSSWCLNGRMNAAKALEIPLEKLPIMNNHLEGMNEYLKNNQLSRFQRNNRPLRADVLYIALVYEVIPNILTLRNLAINIEREKAERRKDLNIMDQSDRKIIIQEFSQVAYLSPSEKRDNLARKLIDTNKIKKYEVDELSGKIYVEVESETMPGLIYTTCIYGQPTDICCQCLDFLQRGIICKHLRAAALYIEDLYDDNNISDEGDIEDDINDKSKDIENEDNDNSNSSISTSSNEILTYIGHILGSNIPIEVSQSNISISASTSLIADVNDLNDAAIYQQEIKEFLESTTKCLQELQNNLIFLQNLIKSKHSSTQEHFNCSDQNTLMSHLHNIVTLDDFGKAQNLVNVINKETGHHRSVASNTSIIPLAKEKKQKRKPSYKS